MKKNSAIKILFALTALIVLLAPLSGCTRAKHIVVEAKWDGDLCYSIYDDDTVELIAYNGTEEILKIPDSFEGKTLIGFGTKTFENCHELREVYIPSTVTSLPAKLFSGCENLTTVFIPHSVRSIGKNVVFECPEFTTVLFGGTVAGWDAVNVGQIPWTDNYVLINAEVRYNQSWE